MLDKLNLSKTLLLFVILLSACARDNRPPQPVETEDFGIFHTELICPNIELVLIRYARVSQVKEAIQTAYKNKRELRTGENYTVISLPGSRSMKINNLTPEEAVLCDLREIYSPRKDKLKKKYMENPTYNFLW